MGGGRRCTKGALAARGGCTGKRRSHYQHAPRRRGAHRRHADRLPRVPSRLTRSTNNGAHEPAMADQDVVSFTLRQKVRDASLSLPAPPGATLDECDYLRAPSAVRGGTSIASCRACVCSTARLSASVCGSCIGHTRVQMLPPR